MALTRRGRRASLALGVVLIGAAILIGKRAATVDTPQVGESVVDPVAVALFAPRRIPDFWRARLAGVNLDRRVAAAVPASGSCVMVTVDGVPIGRAGSNDALAPASTMKILTGLAALEVLGADHRFVTQLRGNEPDADGVITGDVVFVGGGDPTLATPRYEEYVRGNDRFRTDPLTSLQTLVDPLVARGVTQIDGNIVGDGTRYSGPTYLPSWKPNYRDEGQVGPIGALNVNHGFVDFPPPVPTDDPSAYAAEQLLTLLDRSGIEVRGDAIGASVAVTAESNPIVEVVSPTVRDIVAGMLTSSDNTTAEMLTREIALATDRPPTTTAGTEAIAEAMERRAVRTDRLSALDGSGLSPESRLTCGTLIDAVNVADPTIDEGYADAAESGTLAVRFVGSPFAGELHAKTGQLNGVVGLAGILDGSGARPEIRFAFLANGDFDQDGGQSLQAAVVEALSTYPEAPPVDELVTASDLAGSAA